MKNWFEVENTDELLSPALLFYPERIQQNVNQMIRIAGSADRLRPHIKTYKCREIVDMQLKSGISRFKCATLAEAEMLAEKNVHDVLVAYPLVGPGQKRLLELSKQYPTTRFSALVDHEEQIASWKVIADQSVYVFIDIDVGMHRTGIAAKNAFELFKDIQKSNLHFAGLHVYDGHIREREVSVRTETVEKPFADVNQLISKIRSEGIDPFEVICGGSISFPIHAQFPERTLSPGTTLLWDQGYTANFPDIPMEIAAVLLTRVVSKPGSNLMCLDLGHKAVASEMKGSPVYFPQLPDIEIKVHSEEHLVVETSRVNDFHIGDVLYGFPWHICPTVALHEKALIVSNGKVADNWSIAARKRTYQL